MSCPGPSKISQIYDAMLAIVAASLCNAQEIQDPDNLDACPPGQLANGYGLSFAEGENTDRCIDACGYYQQRSFDIILTQAHEYGDGDIKTRTENYKALMENIHRVIKALSGNHTLAGAVDQSGRTEVLSFKVQYVSDGGPVDTDIQGANYLYAELAVTAEYREPLNGGTD